MINYTNIANDALVPRQTIPLWIQVLIDTMIGYELHPFSLTVKRKAIQTAKFYFFDPGIVRTLRRLPPIAPENADFGEFFEHYIFLELKAWIDYRKPGASLSYWRSQSGFEVDFIINSDIAIEVKAATIAQEKHLTGLKALREENKVNRFVLVCREERARRIDHIDILPWQLFLEQLWSDNLV
jgi:predicted AAA+ superfamily ATPase